MGTVNGAGNVIFFPIVSVLYKLLVVLPNQLTYYVLETITWLTGANFLNVLTKNNSFGGSFFDYSAKSEFFKIFFFIAIVSLLVFAGSLIFGLLRAYTKKSANGEINQKKNMVEVVKRSVGSIVIVLMIPIGFVIINSLISYVFQALFSIQGLLKNNTNNQLTNNTIIAFNQYLNTHYGNGLDTLKRNNGMLIFNIWISGYNLLPEISNNKYISQLILEDGHDLNNIAKSVMSIMKGGSVFSTAGDITFQNADKWNIFLSVLTSLVMLYLIIMFVISVITRLLEVYYLILIAPIVIFGGIAMEKSQGKWIVKTFHKVLTTNVAILGYFFFNIIYSLILSSFDANHFSLRVLQFALLFAGMVLVNQIPKIFMSFLNSDEQVVGNELKEASMQMKTITAPLSTAMGSAFTGTLAFMKSGQNNTLNSYQPISPTANGNNFRV